MPPFIVGRFLTLLGAGLALVGSLMVAIRTREFMRGIPMIGISLHGTVYYSAYLLYFFHPDLTFNLQVFANWGSVVLFHVFWTLAFIVWDVSTGFFSARFIPWVFSRWQRGKFA